MKEVISSTWSFQIIIFFILIFAAFLSLILQYSTAYRVKNEVISIIEKYDGFTTESKDIIANYLNVSSYQTKGLCEVEDDSEGVWYGIPEYNELEIAQSGKRYLYCIQEVEKNKILSSGKPSNRVSVYYNLVFFYKFNLPLLGELGTYRVNGNTDSLVAIEKSKRLIAN